MPQYDLSLQADRLNINPFPRDNTAETVIITFLTAKNLISHENIPPHTADVAAAYSMQPR